MRYIDLQKNPRKPGTATSWLTHVLNVFSVPWRVPVGSVWVEGLVWGPHQVLMR